MTIQDHLKQLRKHHNYTLKELSSYTGDSTGNLSSYENRLRAKDSTLMRLLTKGYFMTKKEAEQTIAVWRKEELEEKYAPQLAQAGVKYNAKAKKGDLLDQYLAEQKLSAKDAKKIKAEIKKMIKAAQGKK